MPVKVTPHEGCPYPTPNLVPVLEEYTYTTKFEVAFCDIDMLRHVNHTRPIVWAETIRTRYFNDILGEKRTATGIGIIMRKIEFLYEQQMTFRENIEIGMRLARFGTTSFSMKYEIWSLDRERLTAHGTTTQVAFDYDRNVPTAVPEEWRKRVLAFERTPPEGM